MSVELSIECFSTIFLFRTGNSCSENFTWFVGHYLLSFRNIKGPHSCVDCESNVDCFFSTRRMLAFGSELRVNVSPDSASERSESRNILLMTIHEVAVWYQPAP
jgi:hypothetical protein